MISKVIYLLFTYITEIKMAKSIKMIVFDMAGTTMVDNHEVEHCFAVAARATGLEVSDERILAIQGWAKRFVFELLWEEQLGSKEHSEYLQKVNASFDKFKEVLEIHYSTEPVTPTVGAVALLTALKSQGVKVVLTTGFYREVTDIILKRLGWFDGLDENRIGNETSFIDMSITSEEVAAGRPAPDMVFKAMQTFNISDSKEVICVGDTPSDLGCGKNANCLYTFGLVNGTHTKEQLEKFDNDGLLASLEDLHQFLISEKYLA